MEAESDITRRESRKKPWNRFDVVYLFLDYFVFEHLFRPRKKNLPGTFEKVTLADADFLIENLNKHRLILWLNILIGIYLATSGLTSILKQGDPTLVVTGLLAPAMVTGGAWYAVSFGGIPEKYIGIALGLTFCMFMAFTLSMTLLIALLCRLTPWPIGLFLLAPIYIGLYLASLLYDNLDGLKIGLDTSLLKFSRATLNYYQKQGYTTHRDTEVDVFDEMSDAPHRLVEFTIRINSLERNLSQLALKPVLAVANFLIASSTELIFQIIELATPLPLDKGEDYERYAKSAHLMGQPEVDKQTVFYVGLILDALEPILGQSAHKDLNGLRRLLKSFTDAQEAAKGKEGVNQELADHLFREMFQQMLSLLSAYRTNFVRPKADQKLAA